MIDWLQAHSTRPEFTCRVQWKPGTHHRSGTTGARCITPSTTITACAAAMRRLTFGSDEPGVMQEGALALGSR